MAIRHRYEKSVKGYNRKQKNNKRPRRIEYLKERGRKAKESMSYRQKKTLYEALKEEQNHQCAYCKVHIRESGGQVDRIIAGEPYSEGNCILACAECNMHKKDHAVDDFLDDMQKQGLISLRQWTMPGGRYHRLRGGEFKPNPKYKGKLSQELPIPKGKDCE